jgi:myo-inositol 2-dehydrogenase/D-chiro-inositol 1-dehydrogenase
MTPLTVALVGAGRIGRMHAENLVRHIPEARLKAVTSPHVDAGWASSLGIPVATTDLEAVLRDPEIEAVVIAAPSGHHAELVRRAVAAGKAVFCEKPLAFDPGVIEEVMAAVRDAGAQLQIGFNRRFDPSIRRLAEAVHAGEAGELHSVRVVNRDPRAPDIGFVRRSGGMFLDFTIHDFDTVRFVSGSEIEEVYAVGAALIDPRIGEAGDIDTAVITLRLTNGALCVIDNSRQSNYGYDQRFEAFGSAGNLAVDNLTPTTMTSSLATGVVTDRPLPSFVERFREAFVAELRAFLRSVRERVPVEVGAPDALAAVRAAVAASISLSENRPVRVAAAPAGEGGTDQ